MVSAGRRTNSSDVNAIIAGTIEKPLCILRKATVTNVANNGQVLSWDIEDRDTHGFHDTGTNPSRVTPNVAGWYRITATVHWASNATGRRAVAINFNGGSARYGQIIPGSSAGNLGVTETRTLLANGTTDYFEVFAYQNSGASLDTADIVGTVFEVVFERNP